MTGRTVTILLLNAGRRVELLNAFRAGFVAEGIAGRIVTTDIQPLAPAWQMGESRHLLPRSRDPGFVEALTDLCRAERVDLVVPLIDPDLPVLAAGRKDIEASGARVLVSAPEAIARCRDKGETARVLIAHGLPGIADLSPAEAREAPLPLFAKPRAGSSAIGAAKVTARAELDHLLATVPDLIVQPFLDGPEFTIDVFCTAEGETLCAVPRRRLAVRGGEVSTGRIERDAELEGLAARAAAAIGLFGPGNVQVIRTGAGPFVLELNPRFGGGAPLSLAGGAPFIGWCLDLARGNPPAPRPHTLEDGLTMMRYDQSLFLPAEAVKSP